MQTIRDFEGLELKNKTQGNTHSICPECSHNRTKKTEKCVYVNISEGFGKCFHCETLFFKDKDSNKRDLSVNYSLPKQEYQNYTNLSENMVKWFKNRGISQNTLIENNITEEIAYFPQIQKEQNSICFNYFEQDLLVDKKYRSGQKHFSGASNAKKVFYNINNIIGCDEVYIVEGEIDCLSLYEIDIKNCISLPNGANDNDKVWINCEKYIKNVKKFYIATDNDEKGNEIAEKIAQRLGRYRCERVLFNGKDANDDLGKGVLKESIKNTYKYPVAGTYSIEDLWESMLQGLNEGPPVMLKPKGDWTIKLNEIYCSLEDQLTVVTGIPSHGKSTFTDWYMLNIANDYNKKVSWFSPEHGANRKFMTKLAAKAMGTHFDKATPELRNEFKEWANERIYLTSAEGEQDATWEWIFKIFKEQMLRYGVNIFVIDAFNKLELPKGETLQQIRVVLGRLSNFCVQHNVNIILVAHPTKMPKDANNDYIAPDLYSVAGSADFRNQTHNGYCIYRDFKKNITTFINLKVKDQDYQGDLGAEVVFEYNVKNGRFYPENGIPDNRPLWKMNEIEIEDPERNIINHIPLDKLNEAFDDVPF